MKKLSPKGSDLCGNQHLGEFTLPGLLKITAQAIPAKKKRRGIDPFTKVEREFAAKPATVRVKVRPLKKIKDASL